jgi:hypothetical protein
VQVLAADGTYRLATTYPILSASGGVTGTFDSVTDNSAFLSPHLTYTPTDVLLTLTQDVTFLSMAQTLNQRAVAAVLDRLPGNDPLILAVLNQTSAAGARQAFDALSGEVHAGVQSSLMEDSRFMRGALLGRMRTAAYAADAGAAAFLAAGGPLAVAANDPDASDALSPALLSYNARQRNGAHSARHGRVAARVRRCHPGRDAQFRQRGPRLHRPRRADRAGQRARRRRARPGYHAACDSRGFLYGSARRQ